MVDYHIGKNNIFFSEAELILLEAKIRFLENQFARIVQRYWRKHWKNKTMKSAIIIQHFMKRRIKNRENWNTNGSISQLYKCDESKFQVSQESSNTSGQIDLTNCHRGQSNVTVAKDKNSTSKILYKCDENKFMRSSTSWTNNNRSTSSFSSQLILKATHVQPNINVLNDKSSSTSCSTSIPIGVSVSRKMPNAYSANSKKCVSKIVYKCKKKGLHKYNSCTTDTTISITSTDISTKNDSGDSLGTHPSKYLISYKTKDDYNVYITKNSSMNKICEGKMKLLFNWLDEIPFIPPENLESPNSNCSLKSHHAWFFNSLTYKFNPTVELNSAPSSLIVQGRSRHWYKIHSLQSDLYSIANRSYTTDNKLFSNHYLKEISITEKEIGKDKYFIGNGVVSRREVVRIPIWFHTRKTCLSYSYVVPFCLLPKGLEDALY